MRRTTALAALAFAATACSRGEAPAVAGSAAAGGGIGPAPPPVTAAYRPLVGDYLSGTDTVSLLEDGGNLVLLHWDGARSPLEALADSTFALTGGTDRLTVRHGMDGNVSLALGERSFHRLDFGPGGAISFRITPLRPPEELRAEALAATPPVEEGDFRPSDLVELVTLDPTIKLEIRYATTNNFMGEVFYSQPRAFLQRPAAEALVRAHHWLQERGYGLLIHDGYRPWYVTKMFWDATPDDLKVFVANPATGSRHNRGCAVDLTLYDLATGQPVSMTGGYDEMSPRSYPDYPGGTSLQRWHRELLRQAMEAQDFTVYEAEWWHFDYKDWQSYRIGNQRFEELGAG